MFSQQAGHPLFTMHNNEITRCQFFPRLFALTPIAIITIISDHLLRPIHIGGNFCKHTGIWRHSAWLATPRNNAHLLAIHQQRSARITATLPPTTFRHTGTDGCRMQLHAMPLTALVIAECLKVHLLQLFLYDTAGLDEVNE